MRKIKVTKIVISALLLTCFSSASAQVATNSTINLTERQKKRLLNKVVTKKGTLDQNIIDFYLKSMKRNAYEAYPLEDFWKWTKAFPEIRKGLLGTKYPFKTEWGKELEELNEGLDKFSPGYQNKYRNLLLAVVMNELYVDDEPLPPPSAELTKRVKKTAEYMKKTGETLVDISKTSSYDMKKMLNVSSFSFHAGEGSRFLEELAYKTSTFPPRKFPTKLEFVKYLIKHYETEVNIIPVDGTNHSNQPQNYVWPPSTPLTAPWPMLVALGTPIPLKECDFAWEHFIKGEGILGVPRGRTYNDDEVKYKVSEWHPGSLPRIIEDGGVCGRQSAGAKYSRLALGRPTTSIAQPNHSAGMEFFFDPEIGIYKTLKLRSVRSDYETKSKWLLGKVDGWRIQNAAENKVYVEYHQGLIKAVNEDNVDGYINSRIGLHLCKLLDAELTEQEKINLCISSLYHCPYNVEVIYKLAQLLSESGDVDALSRLIYTIRMLTDDDEIQTELILSPDTDFDKALTDKEVQGVSQSNWGLIVTGCIIENFFTDKNYSQSINKVALKFLKKELVLQDSIGQTPNYSTIELLRTEYEAKVHINVAGEHLKTEFLEIISKFRKIKDRAEMLDSLMGRISLIMKYTDSIDDKIDLLEFFEKKCPENYDYKYVTSKGKFQFSDFYHFIMYTQVSLYEENGNDDAAGKIIDELEATLALKNK